MPPPLFLSGPCEICGQKTSGRHFGVMSCRSCAAFFRRAATWKTERADCKKENCQIFERGKFSCKVCRLKRCLEVGMDASKFQSNRDLISSSHSFGKPKSLNLPQSLSTFLGRPAFILCCEPDKTSGRKTLIDVSYLVKEGRDLLRTEPHLSHIPYKFNDSLEKISLKLESLRTTELNNKIRMLKKLGKEETMYTWEQDFLRVIKWFANLDEFNDLDEDLMLNIVKAAWIPWTILEKLYETSDYQRKNIFSKTVLMCGNDTCMDMNNYELDLSWLTDYSLDQLTYFFTPPEANKNYLKGLEALIELNPSSIEVNYMLLQLSLQHAGKILLGSAQEATDKLQHVLADNLHKYYVETAKIPNYSIRLSKMMKINREIEREMRDRAERNRIARIFDILKVEFSDLDLIDAT
ncbi:Nuclear Hormone Receptor family [Caenorhabditis elegans]|uniref:Nuclear Hormone Receptor family n=2 Tax=Caenorhabditis elegans TaxID=6239 RepID=H2L017_CAEEL|nr:Nuclear Hormone Receptor family [Caenorhabditis elegans]CCD71006.2 Nuclear Hormone Receptor family [Caenorhabditis elegans]|eukprot:NP_001023923.2 Nuclear Hormone Receptor family [Caenorhabditis elegans]